MSSTLSQGFDIFTKKAQVALLMYAKMEAIDLQNQMRNNAPWTDRTGHARQSLTGSAYRENPTTITIKLAHGSNIPYGIYLELAHEKRYAIIDPTIQANQNNVMKNFQYLIDKLK